MQRLNRPQHRVTRLLQEICPLYTASSWIILFTPWQFCVCVILTLYEPHPYIFKKKRGGGGGGVGIHNMFLLCASSTQLTNYGSEPCFEFRCLKSATRHEQQFTRRRTWSKAIKIFALNKLYQTKIKYTNHALEPPVNQLDSIQTTIPPPPPPPPPPRNKQISSIEQIVLHY